MRILIRSAIRHEPQLTILEADRSYAFFMETNSHGIIGLLTQASTMWHQKFEEGTVRTSLRATLWGAKRMHKCSRWRRQQAGQRGLRSSGYTTSGTQNRRRRYHQAATIYRAKTPKSGGTVDQEYSQGRHGAQIPKSKAAEAGHDPDPDCPSACGRGASRSGPAREQLCGQVDRASPSQRKSEQVCPSQGAGEIATVIDQRIPRRSDVNAIKIIKAAKGKRTPRPKMGKDATTASQHSIFMFMVGRAPAIQQPTTVSQGLSAREFSSHKQSDKRSAQTGRSSKAMGAHQCDGQKHLTHGESAISAS